MNEEQYHIIELYLSNNLSDEDKEQFEAALQTDAELAERFRIYKMLNNDMPVFIEGKEKDEALRRTILHSAQKNFSRDQPKLPFINRTRVVWFAAAASVVIIISTMLLNIEKNLSEAELYAQYADTSNISLIARDTVSQKELSAATGFYNSHDFTSAIPFLESVLQKDPSNLKFKITLSRCYIEVENYEQAEIYLTQIAATESAYKYEAAWLQALSLLKQKRIDDCRNILSIIPVESSYYNKAKALIKKLK